jgi:hypothetical protein
MIEHIEINTNKFEINKYKMINESNNKNQIKFKY